MLSPRNTASMLKASLDPPLQVLLHRRIVQLSEDVEGDLGELVHFFVVEPGDPPATITDEMGFSVLTNFVDGIRYGTSDFMPSWEWIEHHDSGWFELVFVLSDDGFGHVVFVPDRDGVDADLLALCREYALTT